MKLACCRPLTIVVFWLCLQQVDWEDLREEGRRGPARSPESKPDAFICAWKISEPLNEISSNVCGSFRTKEQHDKTIRDLEATCELIHPQKFD